MSDLWAHAFAYVLINEGGYVNDAADTPTNRGITLATLSAYRGRPCTADDVRALTLSEAQAIYKALYWSKVGGDAIVSEAVATVMFDVAVNCGVARAAVLAQTIAGVTADGNIGPLSIAAINAMTPDAFVYAAVCQQHLYYLSVVRKQPAKRKFHLTWQKRCALYLDLLI